jgi:hypothetical protein
VIADPFLRAIHGSSADDLWIVANDYYLHREANTWTRTEREFGWLPFGVWSRSANDVFVAASREMRHFDGVNWTASAMPSVRSLSTVRGVGSDVYALGNVGTIFKSEGTEWSRQMPLAVEPQHLGVTWVESPTSLWVVGDYGTIRHYDGVTWESHSSGTLAQMFAVAGVSGSDIWAAGEAGTMLHFDGDAWQAVPSGTDLDINGLWAEPGGTVIAVAGTFGGPYADGMVLRWNGLSWETDPAPGVPALLDVWGTAPDDIWAVGEQATLHFDGNEWRVFLPEGTPRATLLAVWGSSSTSVWAVGASGAIQHFDGTAWHAVSPPGSSHLLAVGGTRDTVWAVGDDGAIWSHAIPPQ